VTVSGGEPTSQSGFVTELFSRCKAMGIHTALDTAGNVDFSLFKRVLPHVDLLLFDCKCMDSGTHRAATGAGNERILGNLRQLGRGSTPVWVRVPVIPGVNDTEQNMLALREFLSDLPAVKRLDLLAYHNLGAGKHANLGGEYAYKEVKAPPKERMEALAGCFAGAGYRVAGA